jgi:hypothetical protein
MVAPIDFVTVQWARKMGALVQQHLAGLSPADLDKLGTLLTHLAGLRRQETELTEQQLQVILQGLHTKELVGLEARKGGVFVEFTGGGFEYERFLVRADGKVPNNRYESQKSSGS